MDFFESRYFMINRRLLSFLGLWPYETSNIKYLSLSFSVFSAMMMLFPQVIYLTKHSKDLDEMFEVLPLTCAAFINLMKAVCLRCNFKKFKMLLRLTQEDWSNLPKSQEAQIVTRYADFGRKLTLTYLYSLSIFLACYALIPFAVPVLDIISPLNETRPRKLLYPAYYLANQEKYYYVILLSEYVGLVICVLIAIAADTTYFVLLEHICGMQAVLCHRLENLKPHYEFEWNDNDQPYGTNNIGCRVRRCIQLDNRIRVYVRIMQSTFETFLLTDIALGAVFHTCMCIMIVIRVGYLSEIMRFIVVMIVQSIRSFFFSWTGQQVTDYSSGIPTAAYEAIWYLMPIEVQKMLMLLITRSQSPSRIILAGIYIINLESFSWVMKTSISYCMVMISVRGTTENM